MRYFALYVLVEGVSDQDFFPPVIERAVTEVVARDVEPIVELSVEVDVLRGEGGGRVGAALSAVDKRRPGVTAVALHFDGSANPARERSKFYEPLVGAWPAEGWPLLMSLVPVREMEAWALADLEVLRRVVGADWDVDAVFEGEALGRPEKLSDPKRTLNDLLSFSVRPRRSIDSTREYLPILGERMPLDSLRKLASFQQFEGEMTRLMSRLGWTKG